LSNKESSINYKCGAAFGKDFQRQFPSAKFFLEFAFQSLSPVADPFEDSHESCFSALGHSDCSNTETQATSLRFQILLI